MTHASFKRGFKSKAFITSILDSLNIKIHWCMTGFEPTTIVSKDEISYVKPSTGSLNGWLMASTAEHLRASEGTLRCRFGY